MDVQNRVGRSPSGTELMYWYPGIFDCVTDDLLILKRNVFVDNSEIIDASSMGSTYDVFLTLVTHLHYKFEKESQVVL